MNLQVDGYAKWTSKDDEGTFSHIGKVIMLDDDAIRLEDPHGGYMHIPLDDGKIIACRKPVGWSKVKAYVAPIVATKSTPTVKKVKLAKVGSKKEKAIAIYANMIDNGIHPDKSDVIKIFIQDLDMTEKGATTYYYTAKSGNK